jgi:excisionase family DNA binding protein
MSSTTRALSISEVCNTTGLGRTSVYRAIALGDLIARKFGRRTVVLATDLEAFLAKLPPVRASSDGAGLNSIEDGNE